VFGYEICPDTGRKHLQGYHYTERQRSLSAFSKAFGKCHVEKPIGTALQNRAYCLKIRPQDKTPNEKYEEFGELPTQGHRTDWEKAQKDLGTKSVHEVIAEQPQLLPCIRALQTYKSTYLKPVERDVQVIVLYGKGGVGKTRWAYDHHPGLYKKPTGEWWDGYTGQKAILLDDFYGYFKYHDILTILDRYPLNLPIKGGFMWAQYDTVIITSNKHPREWYRGHWDWPLRRRLNKIIEVQCIDGQTRYEEERYPASEEAFRFEEEGYAIA